MKALINRRNISLTTAKSEGRVGSGLPFVYRSCNPRMEPVFHKG